MNDRKTVMSWLEGLTQDDWPVWHSDSEVQETAKAALELLKEQEAVEADVDSEGTCTCRNCGETVGWYPAGCKIPVRLGKFCSECGQAVKWND